MRDRLHAVEGAQAMVTTLVRAAIEEVLDKRQIGHSRTSGMVLQTLQLIVTALALVTTVVLALTLHG